jgi:predicted PurR-regulated permease PerM
VTTETSRHPGGAGAASAGDRIQDAAKTAAAVSADDRQDSRGLGRPGPPVNRRSPLFIGMAGAAGVAITYGIVELIAQAGSVLILIGMAFFVAVGLEPVVGWLTRRHLPRWAAVIIVVAGLLGAVVLFAMLAVARLSGEVTSLVQQLPHYVHSLQNHNSELGQLNAKYHVEQRLQTLLSSHGGSVASGVLAAGKMVFSAVSSALVVAVLSIYFLAGLPQIKLFAYRLVPDSRRPRAILLSDEILARVGGYVLGNLLTTVIIGVGTFVWMLALGIPYPILLAVFVALIDLIPVIGSYIGGAAVSLVALTVSLPVALATLGFYICYKLAEDYLLVPKVMNRTVHVPATVTLVAVLLGGVLLGIVGALVAIPVAAAIRLLLREVVFPRLDQS